MIENFAVQVGDHADAEEFLSRTDEVTFDKESDVIELDDVKITFVRHTSGPAMVIQSKNDAIFVFSERNLLNVDYEIR